MNRTISVSERFVLPAVDLGGTKIAYAFVDADARRAIARAYPHAAVVKARGHTDANGTLKRIAEMILKRTREVERQGWTVLRLVGMGAPGLYRADGSVDPKTVPNIPGFAGIKPARVLERLLGEEWRVYINNDGVVQAMAAAHALACSSDYAKKWKKVLEKNGSKLIYFGPGTGFGAGKVSVPGKDRVAPLPGSQAFFDILVRDGKTAEELIGGFGIGRTAQLRERKNLSQGKAVFLPFVEQETPAAPRRRANETRLNRISGKVVAQAYDSEDREARRQAEQVLCQVGRDLARLIIQLHTGRGKKKLLEWDRNDWQSVKETRLFLVAGLLTKPTGKQVILPAARRALKEAGYERSIHLLEVDRLAGMRRYKGRIGILGASLIVPRAEVVAQKAQHSLVTGTRSVCRFISRKARQALGEEKKTLLIAVDGYAGFDWQRSVPPMRKQLERDGFRVTVIDTSMVFKPARSLEAVIRPSMTDEETFGRVFSGTLMDLVDRHRLDRLRKRLEKYRAGRPRSPRAVLCFGPGAACAPLRHLYDLLLYRDITREEINRRAPKGLLVPLGARAKAGSGKGQPAYLAGKRYHYVDFPVLDKEKTSLLKRIHYYLDDTVHGQPKLIPRRTLDELTSQLVQAPFQLKAFHDEGVWGGQWLKQVRHLPRAMVNCAWAYELMAYHMSIRIPVGDTFLDVPFPNILGREADRIMGPSVRRRFGDLWPIRVNYDDSWKGGDMAIQVHPDSAYIRKWFREPLRQDESYYIMAAEPGAYVHLGVREGVDIAEFRECVRRAEAEGIPFDHRKFVNLFPARQGDLFLIPAGTVHASGKGCVVLELSSTTDRYTFHFYDYLRPDLDGRLREIHAEHAFRMLRKYPHRRTRWVKKNLIQKPRCIRKGKDWAEYVLGRRKDLVFEVRRFEFATAVEDDTQGVPHVLSLAEGDAVVIRPLACPEREFRLPFSQTVIVPACTGPYTIQNPDKRPCKVLKTLAHTPHETP
jgi:hypothetical protein